MKAASASTDDTVRSVQRPTTVVDPSLHVECRLKGLSMSCSTRTRITLSVVGLLGLAIVYNAGAAARAEKPGKSPVPPSAAPKSTSTPIRPDELGFDEIVFVKRKPYSSDHYYTDINNGTSADRFLPANGIYVYDLRTKQERAVVTAASLPGGKGFIGKITLSFDARKVLFDFRENPASGFRIWEVNIDGKALRQVSLPPKDEAQKVARWGKAWHTDDIHPCYLPGGKIMFSSTRSERTVLCGGSATLVAPTLHRMAADGTGVQQLTHSPVSEFCPTVLSDGRIMYHRWEYVDKGHRVAKTIWTMHPDGAMPQELYGGADDTTTVYMYPQQVSLCAVRPTLRKTESPAAKQSCRPACHSATALKI